MNEYLPADWVKGLELEWDNRATRLGNMSCRALLEPHLAALASEPRIAEWQVRIEQELLKSFAAFAEPPNRLMAAAHALVAGDEAAAHAIRTGDGSLARKEAAIVFYEYSGKSAMPPDYSTIARAYGSDGKIVFDSRTGFDASSVFHGAMQFAGAHPDEAEAATELEALALLRLRMILYRAFKNVVSSKEFASFPKHRTIAFLVNEHDGQEALVYRLSR